FTNVSGRIQRHHQAIDPRGESRSDWEILQEILTRLGTPVRFKSASEIFDLIAAEIPSFRGLRYDDIGETGVDAR
ncbi:MAG: molybdopterin-dependent oxidoreductase, partial [Vicinamibacteria bacterium]